MTNDDSGLATIERDLRDLAAPQPGDDRLRLALRAHLVEQVAPVRRRRPRVRAFVSAAAALATASAVAVAALVGAGGTGGPATAAAAVMRRTLAVVTPPGGTIVHVKTVQDQNGVEFVGEWWQESSPPYASRGVKGTVGHSAEFADDGTTSYMYDPTSNTLYEQPDSAPPTSQDPVSVIRQALASGDATVTGTTTIDGTALYAIALSNGVTAYVDESTYVPRYIDEPQRDGSTARLDVVTYEQLPATPQNVRALDLAAQHPDARVDTSPSDWPGGGK